MITSLVHISWSPIRVMINENYEATSSERAKEMNIEPDIIFVRSDGWSLGAPEELEPHAYFIWKDDWVQFARKGDTDWTDISNYGQ